MTIHLPTATRSMENEGADQGGAVTEPTRKKIADRDWIDASGTKVDNEEDATGARYTFLEDGKSFDFHPVTDDSRTRMLAIFGAHTLMGNVTNTWKIEKGDRADSPVDAITERFQVLSEGRWIDRAAGGVGAKIDKDVLANAIVTVMLAAGKFDASETAAKMAHFREKLEDAAYVRTANKVPEVKAEYTRLVGGQAKSIDDLD